MYELLPALGGTQEVLQRASWHERGDNVRPCICEVCADLQGFVGDSREDLNFPIEALTLRIG